MGLFRRDRGPVVVERLDSVCFCSEPGLVPWPGLYRTARLSDGREVPDASRPARWVEDADGGRWEDA